MVVYYRYENSSEPTRVAPVDNPTNQFDNNWEPTRSQPIIILYSLSFELRWRINAIFAISAHDVIYVTRIGTHYARKLSFYIPCPSLNAHSSGWVCGGQAIIIYYILLVLTLYYSIELVKKRSWIVLETKINKIVY